MRRTSASCLAVLLVAACCSSGADVHLPPLPKAPDTVPPPAPAAGEYTLAADDFFPVGSDTPLVIRTSPAGLMTFREMKAGAHHWFVGPGDDDWKTYDAKHAHLYFGRAVGKGRCEVEFFWSEKDAIKTRKVVIDCQGARPPPDDDKKDDVVPPPVDPLAKAVQAAYDADPSVSKYIDKSALAAVCKAVAESLKDVKTAGQLFQVVSGATKARIDDRLKPVRSILGGALGKVLPATTADVLTDRHRDDAAAVLNKFATVLAGVK